MPLPGPAWCATTNGWPAVATTFASNPISRSCDAAHSAARFTSPSKDGSVLTLGMRRNSQSRAIEWSRFRSIALEDGHETRGWGGVGRSGGHGGFRRGREGPRIVPRRCGWGNRSETKARAKRHGETGGVRAKGPEGARRAGWQEPCGPGGSVERSRGSRRSLGQRTGASVAARATSAASTSRKSTPERLQRGRRRRCSAAAPRSSGVSPSSSA